MTPSLSTADRMESRPSVLTEKRPSLTGKVPVGWRCKVIVVSSEAELTPIVVSQLHNTKKHKDELRKARRGSQPKTESPAAGSSSSPASPVLTIFFSGAKANTTEAVVSDSGAESCTEDKLRTAQVFMTGIQSAILSSTIPDVPGDSGEDIVSEVRRLSV